MDDEIVVLWWYLNRKQNKRKHWGRGEHERGERGTDTGTNSFTLLRARSFYRQFVVTKRSICRKPDTGQSVHITSDPGRNSDSLQLNLDLRAGARGARAGRAGDRYRHKLVHITPARSFYRQFVVTKRSVEMPGSAKMPDPG
ncbi:unnamed protein product [Plutella xylostella]|uniref:(diamondback moth) hypothetical protein n=1 Tax=Plutella xylostella TaxID=51655 RepID=A0A8S4DDV8_PLUXY|nr:unnamed protein product [Plutella xylostella]